MPNADNCIAVVVGFVGIVAVVILLAMLPAHAADALSVVTCYLPWNNPVSFIAFLIGCMVAATWITGWMRGGALGDNRPRALIALIIVILAVIALTLHAHAADAYTVAVDYAAQYQSGNDAEVAIDYLWQGYSRACNDGVRPDFLALVAIARYESGYKVGATSPRGKYRGLLQIGKCHSKAMELAGLSWYSEADRCYWGALLFAKHGYAPWSVKARAKRLAAKLRARVS